MAGVAGPRGERRDWRNNHKYKQQLTFNGNNRKGRWGRMQNVHVCEGMMAVGRRVDRVGI